MFTVRLHVVIGTRSCVDLLRHQPTDTISTLLLSPIGASYTRMALHLDPTTSTQSLYDYFAGHIKNRLIIANKSYQMIELRCIQSSDCFEVDWSRLMGDIFDREMDVRVFYAFDSSESQFFPVFCSSQQTDPRLKETVQSVVKTNIITFDKEVMTDATEPMDVDLDVEKVTTGTNTELLVSHAAVETDRVDICHAATDPHVELTSTSMETEAIVCGDDSLNANKTSKKSEEEDIDDGIIQSVSDSIEEAALDEGSRENQEEVHLENEVHTVAESYLENEKQSQVVPEVQETEQIVEPDTSVNFQDDIIPSMGIVNDMEDTHTDMDDSMNVDQNDAAADEPKEAQFKPLSFQLSADISSDEEDFELPVEVRQPPVVEKPDESDQNSPASETAKPPFFGTLNSDDEQDKTETEMDIATGSEPAVIENTVGMELTDDKTQDENEPAVIENNVEAKQVPDDKPQNEVNDKEATLYSNREEEESIDSDDCRDKIDDLPEVPKPNENPVPASTPTTRRSSVTEASKTSSFAQVLSKKFNAPMPTPRSTPLDALKKSSSRNDIAPIPLVPLLPSTSKPKQDISLPKLKELRVHASQFGKNEKRKKVIEAPVFAKSESESSSSSSSSDDSSSDDEMRKRIEKEKKKKSITKRPKKAKKPTTKPKRRKYSGIAELALQQV